MAQSSFSAQKEAYTTGLGWNNGSSTSHITGSQQPANSEELPFGFQRPVTGGMGMSMMQKMGWRPGDGLGRNKDGNLEPLLFHAQNSKRGLISNEEFAAQNPVNINCQNKNQSGETVLDNAGGKHPVSLLIEYCTRRHYLPPLFSIILEEGPSHKKNFLYKVIVNGTEYRPENPSPNKKQAKTEAALLCLKALGLLPNA